MLIDKKFFEELQKLGLLLNPEEILKKRLKIIEKKVTFYFKQVMDQVDSLILEHSERFVEPLWL
jgi:hypothetical protein